MRSRTLKLLLVLAIAALFAVMASLILSVGRAPRFPPVPSPNGYDDFVKAGEALAADQDDLSTSSIDGLRALVATNAESLRLVRLGLSRRCRVPTEAAITNLGGAGGGHIATLTRVARLLAAEGRLAEAENRSAEAAGIYFEIVRFGNEASRGGLLIHRLAGIAYESIGLQELSKLAVSLNCDQARPIIASLEEAETNRVTWDEIHRNESAFVRHQLHGIRNPIRLVEELWDSRSIIKPSQGLHNKADARVRLLATELALRCYRAELGHAPARLEDLVPKYLRKVPLDPFSSQPFIYKRQGATWLVYSVGPDHVDDGGKRIGRGLAARGDVFFDSP